MATLLGARIIRIGGFLGFFQIGVASAQAQAGGMSATVIDSARMAVANVEISLPGPGRVARTDSLGRAFFGNLPAGRLEVTVRHIGFHPESFSVDIRPSEIQAVEVQLSERSTELASVNVVAGGGHPFFQGFEQRRARGVGTFITRAHIDSRNTARTSDLFRTLPMVQLVRSGAGMGIRFPANQVTARRAAVCTPMIWVDGQRVPGMEIDDVAASDIHAIEMYRGSATTPGQFVTGGAAPCGAIIVWTRRKAR